MRMGGANARQPHPRLHRPVPRRRRARLVAGRAPDRLQPRLRSDRRRQRRPHRPDDHESERDPRADAAALAGLREQAPPRGGQLVVVTGRHPARGHVPGSEQPVAGLRHLHGRARLARHPPDHAVAAQRRQPRLLARRPTDRLQLRLGGADALQPVHGQRLRARPCAASTTPASTTRSRPSSAPRATRSSTSSPAGRRPCTWRAGRSAAPCASGSPGRSGAGCNPAWSARP